MTRTGTPLDHHGAGRRLDTIVRRAGLDIPGLPKITPHQLRYTFGSLLIDVGESTARVARLMGHANEAITGAVYAHEIDRRNNAERTRAAMRTAFSPPVARLCRLRDRGEQHRRSCATAAHRRAVVELTCSSGRLESSPP